MLRPYWYSITDNVGRQTDGAKEKGNGKVAVVDAPDAPDDADPIAGS